MASAGTKRKTTREPRRNVAPDTRAPAIRSAQSAPGPSAAPRPTYTADDPHARVYVGDCRHLLPAISDAAESNVDLVFADPPFNWNRAYDQWNDGLPREEYLAFTYAWLDLCAGALRPGGAMWVNIPDDSAAEIVVHLKSRGLSMVNWCVWHYRFGQNTLSRFINSKVHALYFLKPGGERTWNPEEVMEQSDRAAIYADPRTQNKRDGAPPGLRVPMDVWYGKFWGRIQGNNAERRHGHDNQLPEVYLERVIRSTSNEGDLVLDPFLGSGTTGVVARVLNRRFIGIEYSAANAQRAWERMLKPAARVTRQRSGPGSTAIFLPRKTRAVAPGPARSPGNARA